MLRVLKNLMSSRCKTHYAADELVLNMRHFNKIQVVKLKNAFAFFLTLCY